MLFDLHVTAFNARRCLPLKRRQMAHDTHIRRSAVSTAGVTVFAEMQSLAAAAYGDIF